MPPPYSFRPHEHLRRPEDFRRIYERRCSVSDARLIVYAARNDLPYSRLGLSVSRKFGPAVRRNRLRRIYREAFRLSRQELPTGLDLILIPRDTELPTLNDLKQALPQLVGRVAGRIARDVPKQKQAEP
jgi:ribonuclease P protein component